MELMAAQGDGWGASQVALPEVVESLDALAEPALAPCQLLRDAAASDAPFTDFVRSRLDKSRIRK